MSTPEPTEVSNVETRKEDVNADGVLDNITITTTTTDFSNDGIIDVTEVHTVTVDGATEDTISTVTDLNINNGSLDALSDIQYVEGSAESILLVSEIQALQDKIKCSKFHGKGSMEDYAAVFKKIQEYFAVAGDSNVEITVDVTSLDQFAEQAKNYSAMFEEILIKFNRVSSVDDSAVLKKIKQDLIDISKMYENIEKFKAIVTGTTGLKVPKTIKDCTDVLENVYSNINCSLDYINRFADKNYVLTEDKEIKSQLSEDDKKALDYFAYSIQVWIDMIDNEGTVAMNTNSFVKKFKESIAKFDLPTENLTKAMGLMKERMARWKSGNFA